ncbi:CAP domain-containing protein [Parasedimentitalea psychrophila]|uniref:CAP domain-containing protein n=1 Tax=Parasedimentitalea psychrophila TaxID=2997337 RepID=A0A9Y2L1Z9_9RHOB|nr:CAP domain-containing protein [Parasedimentitalea psychrophila]WIY26848.1 CAP domain-containing protein [Parasedimentitalea psychrophila]
MKRVFLILAAALLTLAVACTPSPNGGSGGSGKAYRIRNADKVQFRMLDSVNALRQAYGSPAVQLNAPLNAAAATHSRDMAVQNRPWHFGSDGSSPLDRVARAGYTGSLMGEAISETYEGEVETLSAWMEDSNTKAVIMDPKAVNMGFSWFQEQNGKIWWTLVMGS